MEKSFFGLISKEGFFNMKEYQERLFLFLLFLTEQLFILEFLIH
jgi:hypothetical protein